MMNTVKDVMHTIGDGAMRVGEGSADLAKRVGNGSVDVARRVGPRRALIGLAVVAAAVGTTILIMRYRRARRERPLADDTATVGTSHKPTASKQVNLQH